MVPKFHSLTMASPSRASRTPTMDIFSSKSSATGVEQISTRFATHDLFITSESANAMEQHFKPPKKGNIEPLKSSNVESRDLFTPNCDPILILLFLNISNPVSITEGDLAGARGTINKLSPDYALVTLDEDTDETLAEVEPVLTEVKHITRWFDYGVHVQVKVGTFAGRSGIIGNVDGVKKTLHIINCKQNEVGESFVFLLTSVADEMFFDRWKCHRPTLIHFVLGNWSLHLRTRTDNSRWGCRSS